MPCPCRGRSAQLVLPELSPGIVRMMFAELCAGVATPTGLHLTLPYQQLWRIVARISDPPRSCGTHNSKNINPGACHKPSPELLRCRAGAIPDEQRDGSLPVKLVAVAEASGQRKTRRRGNALRASLWKVLHRIAVRTCGASAKRGRLASPISSRAKFFRRGVARSCG